MVQACIQVYLALTLIKQIVFFYFLFPYFDPNKALKDSKYNVYCNVNLKNKKNKKKSCEFCMNSSVRLQQSAANRFQL